MSRERKPEAVVQASKVLDDAVRAYAAAVHEAWDEDSGMMIGWTVGIAMSKFEDGQEMDALIVEQAPGANNFFARGLSEATAEAFALQSAGGGGCTCEDDDE